MARFDTSGLNELINDMRRLGQESGPVADEMLMAGAEAVAQAWKRSAEEHGHRDTGAMIASIGYADAPSDIGGIKSIDIYPQGVDGKGVRNAEKAFILHYGTSRIPGSHWVDAADTYSGQTVPEAMQAIWDKWLALNT